MISPLLMQCRSGITIKLMALTGVLRCTVCHDFNGRRVNAFGFNAQRMPQSPMIDLCDSCRIIYEKPLGHCVDQYFGLYVQNNWVNRSVRFRRSSGEIQNAMFYGVHLNDKTALVGWLAESKPSGKNTAEAIIDRHSPFDIRCLTLKTTSLNELFDLNPTLPNPLEVARVQFINRNINAGMTCTVA